MEAKYLIEISSYKWATLTTSYGGNTYSGIIDPESFSGVTCRLDIESSGLISANDLSFDVINPAGAITRASVKGQFCTVRLIIDGTQSRAWKFIVTDAAEHNGLITIYAEGILNKAVRGSLPKTKRPHEIWASDKDDKSTSDFVVPLILGTAYIPVVPVYIADPEAVHYVMGDSTAVTYTITEIQSPHDWGNSSIWTQAEYTFTQSDLDGYKVVTPLIISDGEGGFDGGVWNSNGLLAPLLKLSRSDTSGLTSPEEWVEYLLEAMGTASADVDTGASSTFETAGTTYAGRGLSFNGGLWVPEEGESIIRSVLIQCDSFLYNGEKIELHAFSATSVETFDRTDTIENSFGISPRTISESDGGHVEWVNAGDPQDVFTGKAEVRLYNDQASVEAVDSEVLTCRFLSDSQHAQIAGILYFAKKFLGAAEASFSVPLDRLSTVATIKPGQVITLNDAVIFGAEYDIIITELTFNDDNSVGISGVRLEYIEDWDDIATDEVSVANYTEQAGEIPLAADGFDGNSSAVIQLYKRASSLPAVPSGTTTYTFSTGVLSGTLDSWTQAIPAADGSALYATQAFKNVTAPTDTASVLTGDWETPVKILDEAYKSAQVRLYVRSASQPALPSTSENYTFATGSLTPTTGGWTQAIPETDGNPLWETHALAYASSVATIDTILASEWSTAVKILEDGADGAAGTGGINTATVFIYKRAATSPAVPAATLTYTFSTKVLSGTLSGWTQTVPANDGNPLWVTTSVATATAPTDTDTISTGEWATPASMAENGADGDAGANGLNTATIYLYQRKATAPAVTDIADPVTYTFATGAITGSIGAWARSIPSGTNPLYVTGASALSANSTDTIARSEWSTPVIMAQDGADGADGADGIDETNWSSAIVFSATDYRTVAWAAGHIYSKGTDYSISAGNTGSMSASTAYYIYLKPATSTTVLQVTTTASNAVGAGQVLVAVAYPNAVTTVKAQFQVFGGRGGVFINADNIAAGCITADAIAANTITAAKIAASTITATEIFGTTLSVIAADCGTLTAGILQSTTFDATHGFKLDLTNATITVNATAGLVVNAAGGITVSDGGALNLTVAANSATPSKIVFTDSVPNVRYEIVSSYVSASATGTFLIDASTAAGSTSDNFIVQDFTYHEIGNDSASQLSLDADGPATLQGYTTTDLITIEGTSGVHVIGDTTDGVICWGTGSTMVFAVAVSAHDYVGGVGADTKFYIKSDGELHIYSDVIPSASGTCDLGSTTYELGDVFIADDKAVKFGNDQDATIGYDESTDNKLEITCASGIALSGAITTVNAIIPTTDGSIDLGSSSYAWNDLFVEQIQNPNGDLYLNDTIKTGAIYPDADGTKDLGTTAAAFGTAFLQTIKNPNDANGYSASLHDGDNDIRFKWDGTDLLVKIDNTVFKITLTEV